MLKHLILDKLADKNWKQIITQINILTKIAAGNIICIPKWYKISGPLPNNAFITEKVFFYYFYQPTRQEHAQRYYIPETDASQVNWDYESTIKLYEKYDTKSTSPFCLESL